MRTAANILSSSPAMQIRYLDTMQNMAKSSNSKVIFMPGPSNPGDSGLTKVADEAGEGPNQYGLDPSAAGAGAGEGSSTGQNPFDPSSDPFQQTMNARVVEDI